MLLFTYLHVSFAAGLKPSIKFDPAPTMTSTPSPGGSETLPSSPSLTCAQVSISSTSQSVKKLCRSINEDKCYHYKNGLTYLM